MARVALQCLVLIHTLELLALVSGMPPGPTRTRLQCPSCFRAFESETGLRQHHTALGRNLKGGSQCITDNCLPFESDWSVRGQRPAGMTQNLKRAAARLQGLTDSDSDGGLDRDPAGQGGAGSQSPVPGPPADGPAAPPAPADRPAAPPAMPQILTIGY
jgi:hypothetical protein